MDTAHRMLKDILDNMCPPASAQSIEIRRNQALRNLAACYRKAQKDATARIPSYLEAAIENLAALTPQPANIYGERRAEPRYQEQRDGGTDMSPRGGQLEPGS